jgi:DNA-directed RNA polymerase subunit RPC12/RpoP
MNQIVCFICQKEIDTEKDENHSIALWILHLFSKHNFTLYGLNTFLDIFSFDQFEEYGLKLNETYTCWECKKNFSEVDDLFDHIFNKLKLNDNFADEFDQQNKFMGCLLKPEEETENKNFVKLINR